MKYRSKLESVYSAHKNAWFALNGAEITPHTVDEVIKEYWNKYHIKLIFNKLRKEFEFVEFESEEQFVLFMLEWS